MGPLLLKPVGLYLARLPVQVGGQQVVDGVQLEARVDHVLGQRQPGRDLHLDI